MFLYLRIKYDNMKVIKNLFIVIAVVFSKLIGCILPIGAKRIGVDPTVMASPFITTIVDTISLAVYFNVAIFLLKI